MDKKNNSYYVDYPLYLQSFSIENHQVNLVVFNDRSLYIKVISFQVGNTNILVDVSSSEQILSLEVKHSDITFSDSVIISKFNTNDKTYIAEQYKLIHVTQPKSVHQLGFERFLYKNEISKLTDQTKERIEYIAENYSDYWICTCGHIHGSSEDVCAYCGNDRKKLFSYDNHLYEISRHTDKEVNQLKYTSVLLSLALLFQLFIQGFMGDFLFLNNIKNEAFGILNRFILPVLLILSIVGLIFAKLYYKKVLHIILDVIRHAIILYLNIVMIIVFVGTAYNLVFVYLLDILMIYNFVKYQNFKRYQVVFQSSKMIFLVISILLISVSWIRFGSYRLVVNHSGLNLTVETSELIYDVPEKINGIDVSTITFDRNFNYDITTLNINASLNDLYIYSTSVLEDLEVVTVNDDNPNFYVENNILYKTNGDIKLVPIVIEHLTVNDQVIESHTFRDLYNLKTLTIGSHVEVIKDEAFENAIALEEIIFEPNSHLESIGKRAFANAQNLIEISFPISVQHMGIGVLEGADHLTSLTVPFLGEKRESGDELRNSTDVLAYIFGSATYTSNELIPNTLKTVEIYDIEMIHHVTFYRAWDLEHIILPDELSQIGIRSFYQTFALKDFELPSGIEIIPSYAFEQSGIETLIIPGSVTYIEANAFKSTTLVTVTYLGDINNLVIEAEGNQSLIDAIQN